MRDTPPDPDRFGVMPIVTDLIRYKFDPECNSLNLDTSRDGGKTWMVTPLKSISRAIRKSYHCGRNSIPNAPTYLRENVPLYFTSILVALLLSVFFVFLLGAALETKLTVMMVFQGLLFYGVVLVFPVYIIPEFAKMFSEMGLLLPLLTRFYCIVGSSAVAVFMYVLSFNILSPLVLCQIVQFSKRKLPDSTLGRLSGFSTDMLLLFCVLATIFSLILALFMPLIA